MTVIFRVKGPAGGGSTESAWAENRECGWNIMAIPKIGGKFGVGSARILIVPGREWGGQIEY